MPDSPCASAAPLVPDYPKVKATRTIEQGTWAGQTSNLHSCSFCGATVHYESIPVHTLWHQGLPMPSESAAPVTETYRGPTPGFLRLWWMKRRGWRSVCWFCHADAVKGPCPCGWAPLRRVVFIDQDGKRYTNEVGAGDHDPWRGALIIMPGMGKRIALPLEVKSA